MVDRAERGVAGRAAADRALAATGSGDVRGKRILLIVGGGIAAYKCLELIRRGRDRGLAFRVVLTRSAAEFVTPLSLATLSGDKVYSELFSLTDEAEIGHIRLSREADLLVVAPATASLLARMSTGQADDLATTVLLATDKPVLVAPAMNPFMWNHPATRRNVERLRADGVHLVGPNPGDMACGEEGSGRMAEPHEILAAADRLLSPGGRPLEGLSALVTSGPTYEAIDPVRYVANRSSGRQGHSIAAALAEAGAEVTLVTGPVALPDPAGVRVRRVVSAREMLAAVEASLPADVAVFAAAGRGLAAGFGAGPQDEEGAGRVAAGAGDGREPRHPALRRPARGGRGAAPFGRGLRGRDWRRSGGEGRGQARAQGLRLDPRQRRLARHGRLRRRSQPGPAAGPRRHARGMARTRQG
jgi:phosphopantothenoylcysteine decarboxylase/phosphopantothenate--cysteine ligase